MKRGYVSATDCDNIDAEEIVCNLEEAIENSNGDLTVYEVVFSNADRSDFEVIEAIA